MPVNLGSSGTSYSTRAYRARRNPPSRSGWIVFLLVVLGVLAVVFRDRLSWYADLVLVRATNFSRAAPDAHDPLLAATPSKSKPSAVSTSKKVAAAAPPSTDASVTTNVRVVLPPLSVEVISAGGHRTTIHSHNSPVHIDLDSKPATATEQTEPAATVTSPVNAAVHAVEPPGVVDRSVAPVYPRLAEQMKIQGAVVLNVDIDKGGNIENITVISGPDILAAAAREAVRKWRFRPHYKNGQPIETEARVVVNFVISTQ